jgi:serine acetyltransferase
MKNRGKDINGWMHKYVYLTTLLTNKSIFTFICRNDAFLKKIHLGKGTTFNGKTLLVRKPSTKIIIGKNCHFTSNYTTNLIGVNRRCIVAAHKEGSSVIIGNNCGFSGTVIGAFKSITLGNNVRCGANTLITDSDWHDDDPRAGEPKEVVIEDNVWLGVNVVVLKGVTIGKNSVIGANSVVTKSIPENVIAAGNPCKVIRSLPENIVNEL